MGCDIHSVVLRRAANTWEPVEPPADLLERGTAPWDERNYTLFGVLADVRDHDVEPISWARGLPDDIPNLLGSTYGEHRVAGQWMGDHSHSWVSARELRDYPWDAVHPTYPALGTLREILTPDRWIGWLLTLASDPDDVRLVFGFDS